jgi:hypothetical protein
MHEFYHCPTKVITPNLSYYFSALVGIETKASMLHVPTWDILIAIGAT